MPGAPGRRRPKLHGGNDHRDFFLSRTYDLEARTSPNRLPIPTTSSTFDLGLRHLQSHNGQTISEHSQDGTGATIDADYQTDYSQSYQNPTQIFAEDVIEEKGENARLSAFVGAIAVGDLVKSTLGPKGMDKILQSGCVMHGFVILN